MASQSQSIIKYYLPSNAQYILFIKTMIQNTQISSDYASSHNKHALSDISNNLAYTIASSPTFSIKSSTDINQINQKAINEEREEVSFENFVSGIYESELSHRKLPKYNNSSLKSPQNQKNGPLKQIQSSAKRTSNSPSNIQSQLQVSKLKFENKQISDKLQFLNKNYAHSKQECQKLVKILKDKEQEISKLHKKSKDLQETIKQEKIEQDKILETNKTHSNEQIKKYMEIIDNMKEKAIQQQHNHEQEQNQATQTRKQLANKIQSLSKDLRIKDKQIQKYEQILQERSQYYDEVILKKDEEIETLRNKINEMTQNMIQEAMNSEQELQMIKMNMESLEMQMLEMQKTRQTYEQGLKEFIAIIEVAEQHQKGTQIYHNKSHLQQQSPQRLLKHTKQTLFNFIKKTNKMIEQVKAQPASGQAKTKVNQVQSRKAQLKIMELTDKMNILADENVFLRNSVEKNLSGFSVEKARSEKSLENNKNDMYSRGSQMERNIDILSGQKNMFRMKLKDLQRERKFQSVDVSMHHFSQPHLLRKPILHEQFVSNSPSLNKKYFQSSQYDSKSTSYFINQNRKSTAVFIHQLPTLNEPKLKIKQQIQNAKEIFEGTTLKQLVIGDSQGVNNRKRGRSMPSLKKQSLRSWKKPKSKILAEYLP